MKRVAAHPDEAIIGIPDIVRIIVVGIQPALAIRIAVHIERTAKVECCFRAKRRP